MVDGTSGVATTAGLARRNCSLVKCGWRSLGCSLANAVWLNEVTATDRTTAVTKIERRDIGHSWVWLSNACGVNVRVDFRPRMPVSRVYMLYRLYLGTADPRAHLLRNRMSREGTSSCYPPLLWSAFSHSPPLLH